MVSNGSGRGDVRRWAIPRRREERLETYAQDALNDHFSGSLVRGWLDHPSALGEISPLLDIASDLLEPDGGFLTVLSTVFDVDLQASCRNLLLIQGLWSSAAFMRDKAYRRTSLQQLCARQLESPGFLLVHPPTTLWSAREQNARFRLNRMCDKNLELCVLFGAIGLAQICDDRLGHPIPLLVQPWSPESGLLQPRKLPAKSFSQMLCVERVAERRLVLFDKQCLDGMTDDG